MKASPLLSYLPVLLMFGAAVGLASIMFIAHTLLGKKRPTPEKLLPFECGSESTGAADLKPSVKFYLTAILFVVFDVEAVFIYPWATHFRALGWMGFVTMGTFIASLLVALVYVWRKGALDWEN